jgi:hypothetical protein
MEIDADSASRLKAHGSLDPLRSRPRTTKLEVNMFENMICLDIETERDFTAWKALGALPAFQPLFFAQGAWIAVTQDSSGAVQRWTHHQAGALWAFLCERVTVGWNILEFDLPIIASTAHLHEKTDPLVALEVIDVFHRIHKDTRVMDRLEEVARLNFGEGKLRSSADIPQLLRDGQLETVFEHCERDVELEWRVVRRAVGRGLLLPAKLVSKYLPEGRAEGLWHLEPTVS